MELWNVLPTVAATVSATFAAASAWTAHRVLTLDRSPVVTIGDSERAETFDATVKALRNAGRGAAFNVCIHQNNGSMPKEFVWIGDIAPSEPKRLETPLPVTITEAHPHRIFYQDSGQRWFSTRIAKHGYGLASVPEGRRLKWSVPADLRRNASAETTVEYYRRLVRRGRIRKLWAWLPWLREPE